MIKNAVTSNAVTSNAVTSNAVTSNAVHLMPAGLAGPKDSEGRS